MDASFDLYNPTEAHQTIREMVRRFGRDHVEPQAKDHDEHEKFNTALFKRFATELYLFGITVPEEDGGIGLDPTATVIVCEELSRFDPGLTLSYLAHEVLFINNFYHGASPQLRAKYLPAVVSGECIAGMAMTEPEAGTDVMAMRTTAVKDGDHYVLNGVKQFITNAVVGQIFFVYAKIKGEPRRVTAFVVESGFDGFSFSPKESKLGMRSSPTGQLILEDCVVPAENLIGEENTATVHMMRNLEIERVTLAAMSTGICLRCVEEMSRYAICDRQAFGRQLIEFGQIQNMVAESYARTEAARALLYKTAAQIHPEQRRSLGAAATKLVAATTGEFVARAAIQVLGGYGYCREYVVERMLRDAILLSIGGGTNEAMQKNIASDLRRMYV